MHLKLDELIRVTSRARNSLIGEEQEPERQVERDERKAQRDARS